MSAMQRLKNGEYHSFSAYIRALVIEGLSLQSEDLLSFDADMDGTFLDAVNGYLTSENQKPIDYESIDELPKGFVSHIAHGMDLYQLSLSSNIYNSGDEVQERVSSRERNGILADLHHALADYMTARGAPVLVKKFNTYNVDEIDPEDKTPTLYKYRLDKDEQGKDKRVLEAVEHIDFSKRAVICVGGTDSVNVNKPELYGLVKQAENLLGGKELHDHEESQGVELYCIAHQLEYRCKFNENVLRYNQDPERYVAPYVEDVFRRYMQPMLDEAVGQDAQNSSLVHGKAALRKLNFFTTCYGGAFVKSLCNVMTRYYEEQGYGVGQIKTLLSEVFGVQINPTVRLDDAKPCGNFSSIYVVSDGDNFVRTRSYVQRLIGDKSQPFHHIPVDGKKGEYKDNELLIWVDRPKQGVVADLINQALDYRDGKPKQASAVTGDEAGHNVKLNIGDVYERIGDAGANHYKPLKGIANALRNAVTNKVDRWNMREMMDRPAKLFNSRYPDGIRFSVRSSHAEAEEMKRGAANENGLER